MSTPASPLHRLSLDGRVALVTGAAQGIGAAIAATLAGAGARIHAVDVAAIDAGTLPPGATLHRCDLSDRESTGRLIERIAASGPSPDVVVNAAGGVCGQHGRPIDAIGDADWHAIFGANVDSAFWLAQAVAPAMRVAGRGSLVFIASGAGLRPSLTGIQAYTAAKHALVGLTRQLSQELGPHGIRCNAVAPGFVRSNPSTERQWRAYGDDGQRRLVEGIHLRRLGTAQDIADAVLFLAGDLAGWISGQVLSVDGGRS